MKCPTCGFGMTDLFQDDQYFCKVCKKRWIIIELKEEDSVEKEKKRIID